MKTHFEKLPIELINIVFNYCNQTSLRNLGKIVHFKNYSNIINKFIENDLQLTRIFQALKILSKINFCLEKRITKSTFRINSLFK